MADYSKMTPPEVWKLIRTGEITRPTAGMCAGYAQANLVILPKKYADDFKEFARKNPKPCPILEVVEGTPDIHDMGEGASIMTDIPKYFIYRDGVKVDEVTDVSSYWKEDSVAFLIGCSFSFEEALMKAGIEVRHIAQGCNVSMYKTNIQCESAGVFKGPMVVSMRPMSCTVVRNPPLANLMPIFIPPYRTQRICRFHLRLLFRSFYTLPRLLQQT